jgi:hypothetical protein
MSHTIGEYPRKEKSKQPKCSVDFEHENPNIDSTLKQIRGVIFIKEPKVELMIEDQQQNKWTVKELLSCYHVQEEALDEDDPHKI